MPDRFSKRKSGSRAEVLPMTSLPAQLGNQGMLLQFERHKFTQEEDAKLQQLVTKYGTNQWSKIEAEMHLCTARQCKERWTKLNGYEPHFSRKKPTPRVPTMYGMINKGLQGPHTFPFGLWDVAAQNMDFSTFCLVVPTPVEFQNDCKNEEISLDQSEIDTYNHLYNQFMAAEQAQTDPSDCAFPGNMDSLGFIEASTRMINMSPYSTYGWREGLDLSSKEGKKAMAGKGTELAAVNAYRKGSLTKDKIMKSIDGHTDNDFIHPKQYEDRMNFMSEAVLSTLKPEEEP